MNVRKSTSVDLVWEDGDVEHKNYPFHKYGVKRSSSKSTSTNMQKLWEKFSSDQDYPELYIGRVENVAVCKCPITGEEQKYNVNDMLNKNPFNGERVLVQSRFGDVMYHKEFIFMKWDPTVSHEWKMKSGIILRISQWFIDGLFPSEKKYLRMHTLS